MSVPATLTINDVRDRATLTVPEVGGLLGMSRDHIYAAVARGDLPSLRVGNLIRVPVPALLTMLGERQEGADAA